MKTLSCPDIDNVELLDKIVKKKQEPYKSILQSVRSEVVKRYKVYSDNYASLDNILPESNEKLLNAKDALHKCYSSSVDLDKIRHQILACGKCPYCMLNRPNTLDHYFDKSEYPEYSAFVPNLLPCCSECNSQKNTSMFNDLRQRLYLHYYFDTIPDEQFLFVKYSCTRSDPVPKVKVYIQFQTSNYESDLISRHFKSLHLVDKYEKQIVVNISPALDVYKNAYEDGVTVDDLIKLIAGRVKSLSLHFGKNYWEAVMYQGFLEDPDFLKIQ